MTNKQNNDKDTIQKLIEEADQHKTELERARSAQSDSERTTLKIARENDALKLQIEAKSKEADTVKGQYEEL